MGQPETIPNHVPRFSRPLYANCAEFDGANYQYLYQNFVKEHDVASKMGEIFLVLGDCQGKEETFTPYTDLLERMLNGLPYPNAPRLWECAVKLEAWRRHDLALFGWKMLPDKPKAGTKRIPFEYIRQYTDPKAGETEFDQLNPHEFRDIFGNFFLDYISRLSYKDKKPHIDLVERMLNGHDYPFAKDLRKFAVTLDNLRGISIRAAIREYWRSADDMEEKGAMPGTFEGMEAYMCKCGLFSK